MKPLHVLYKELSVDEKKIFTPDITEKHEVKNVGLKYCLNMQ